MQYNAYTSKSSFMYVSSWDTGRFVKNFRFNTIGNVIQELQELQRLNCACGVIGKFIGGDAIAVKSYKYQREIVFWSVLATASSSTPPYKTIQLIFSPEVMIIIAIP